MSNEGQKFGREPARGHYSNTGLKADQNPAAKLISPSAYVKMQERMDALEHRLSEMENDKLKLWDHTDMNSERITALENES